MSASFSHNIIAMLQNCTGLNFHIQLFAAWSLVCYCQRNRLCDGDVDVCDRPTDVCFVKIALENGELVYGYGCQGYLEEFNGVKERCLAGIVNNLTSMQCCVGDRCNEHLNPSPPHLYKIATTNRDPIATTPITPSAGPRSGTGMGPRYDQSIPHIPMK